jgi:putative ABC transport system permease protein
MANRRAGDPDNTNKMCAMVRVDYDFLPAYKIGFISGRNFSKAYPTDKEESVIMTETAMRNFGFKNAKEAVNGFINLEGHKDRKFKIIGITNDYHQESLKENYRAIIFIVYNPWGWINNHYVSVKLHASGPGNAVAMVHDKFRQFFPQSSFDYFFLDDYYNRQYQQDVKYGQLIMFFSILALFIVCLGLIGLSSFMLLKRKKEIGIRKVIGAGIFDILGLLNIHFLKLVLLAFCIAAPVAWVSMHYWLQGFANRTSIGLTVFAIAIGITGFITILTVSMQSYKTASTKPVDSLRCD